jgi:tyrosyl-DNA phosphodiesterase-1
MILGLWNASTGDNIASSGKGSKDAPINLDDSDDSDDEVEILEPYSAGWLYVGSHNFTPSAW